MGAVSTELEVKNLSAGYGGTRIVDGISFSVANGGRFGIVGRNGSGKTTTLASIMGLTNLFGGSIKLAGEEIASVSTYRRALSGLGYVPQTRDIFPSLTVEENLLAAQTARSRTDRLDYIYDLFPRLKDRRRNGGTQLSGGEQQMLSIARALVCEPRILLLDEPLEGLAPRVRNEVMAAIRKLASDTGVGCILVEQYIDVVLDFAEQLLVLENGKAVFHGSRVELEEKRDILDRAIGLSGHGIPQQNVNSEPQRRKVMNVATLEKQAARSDIDPWSAEFMRDPFPFYETLRALGPIVELEKHGIWSVAHYNTAKEILDDHHTFLSSGGAGLANFHKEKPWRPPSIILEADQPVHTKSRAVLTRILSPASLKALRTTFEAEAERMIQPLVERGEFDAITELADRYPFKVFPDAVGLDDDGRENLVAYGKMVFAGFGPKNESFVEAMSHAPKVIPYINEKCRREALAPGSLGAKIYESVDTGELTEEEAGMLVRSFLSAGIDTTVNGIGQALYSLARHPDQWSILRDDPSLARAAFDETLRFDSSAPFVFRTTAKDIDFHGTRVPKHEKILVFLNSANRDPDRWPNPDVFDIRRKPVGHLGFGGGIHGCVGQMVARMEAESVLTALTRRVDKIEISGPVQQRPSSGLRGVASLPVRVTRR